MQTRRKARNSLAETYKARLRAPANRQVAEAKLHARAISVQKHGDDNIYTMPDFSRLLHRVLVDEYHVFDNRVTEITEDMARVAIMKFPHLVAKMRLSAGDEIIYKELMESSELTIDGITDASGLTRSGVDKALKRLLDNGYISKRRATNSVGAVVFYSSVL